MNTCTLPQTHLPDMHNYLSYCPYTHISNTPNTYAFCAQSHPPHAPIFPSPAPYIYISTPRTHTHLSPTAHTLCSCQHSPPTHKNLTLTQPPHHIHPIHTHTHSLTPATHIPNSHLHKHTTPQQSTLKGMEDSQPRALESEACSSAWTFSHTQNAPVYLRRGQGELPSWFRGEPGKNACTLGLCGGPNISLIPGEICNLERDIKQVRTTSQKVHGKWKAP